MKTVNAKWLAFKYKMAKKLSASVEKDKKAIKEGAKITFERYCNIKQVECTRTSLDKTKVQELCNKYDIDITTLEKATNYIRIDIDNIPNEIDLQVEQAFNTLENSNSKVISKVASKVANIK
jgi:hypothetical protein